ncbi:bifunctional metallophosphatase/5'-nucleotidase [Pediococcus pentosaceus]|uniref:Bifunctional metallophosphatase/5'-nucleotidase n=1 Tax=Pediococcus pentosaceus TaxID=1255 RepID=A0A6L5A0Y0_PEDPE|nr:bifunctional UDP-sugar hydrolase/5'-nucleotidase [Pediococcus pentosaceus]KAF0393193.1 bifunctional metallophosphatase/5'-nucleotidase [Pediococcus pentosaceus]KAF0412327.1 bifunctional metallophosphatase/5'-nucleotidase [Pediococcus pentosaceus]KAF0420778.1 bifunctional metallophosphatase/5'-nucleotidase [Pediococcus pentosaceus]KAF0433583.1 bifunctional metallophosphatase/5'-nucleotidase [Pediococcus pentosaceus]KAF0501308.1 bifunctional metallophosphatase/5'-nucleotidase [Pediococcus pen
MKIRILSTSDVHGYFYPTDFSTVDDQHELGFLKAASLIGKIKEQEETDEIVIYVENGDIIEGSPMDAFAYNTRESTAYSQQITALIDQLAPDAGVLGNHEFNYGLDYLAQTLQNRNYPILGANISGPAAGKIIDAPYKIFEKKGVKFAIIGLTTQFIPHWEDPANIAGLQFHPVLESLKLQAAQLRPQVDVLIVAYHGGFEADLNTGEPTEKLTGENEGSAILREVPEIDALITGHQHRTEAAVVNGIPTTQPGYRGSHVGEITLELDEHKNVSHSSAQLLSVADQPLPAAMEGLAAPWFAATQQWLDQPVATISGEMRITDPMDARAHGHAYLALVNQVQMAATDTKISGTSLFNDDVQGFGHEVTVRNVMNSYVYPNTLVVEKVSGADLKAALERCASFFELAADGSLTVSAEFSTPKVELYNYDYYSGIDYSFDLTQPVGQRVGPIYFAGSELTVEQEVEVALNQYRGVGGGDYSMFSAEKIIREYADDMPKLIMEYLQSHPEVKAKQPQNLRLIN